MWTWLKRLWNALVDAVLRTSSHAAETVEKHFDLYTALEADTLNLMNAVRDLERFTFDPKWNTRVINVPRAMEGMQEIFDIVLHGFRDKFANLHQSLITLKAALHKPHWDPNPQSRLTAIVDIIGQLEVGLRAFEESYKQLTDIVQTVDDVKKRIETLDDLFLPQGRRKETGDFHYRKRVG